MVPIVGADQLGRHLQLVALLANASFHHEGDVQPGADLMYVGRFALKGKGRSTGRHTEAAGVRERSGEFFRQAIGEVLVGGVGAQVEKRQDGDGGM